MLPGNGAEARGGPAVSPFIKTAGLLLTAHTAQLHTRTNVLVAAVSYFLHARLPRIVSPVPLTEEDPVFLTRCGGGRSGSAAAGSERRDARLAADLRPRRTDRDGGAVPRVRACSRAGGGDGAALLRRQGRSAAEWRSGGAGGVDLNGGMVWPGLRGGGLIR